MFKTSKKIYRLRSNCTISAICSIDFSNSKKTIFMKKVKFLTSLAILITIVALIRCAGPTALLTTAELPDTQMAAYHTDQYVWEKMAQCFQVITDEPVNLEWEMWSTTTYAYSDSCAGVEWPTGQIKLRLLPPKAVSLLDNFNNSSSNFETTQFEELTQNFDNPYYEELRINRAMFDYIQENGLYNQNKVYEMAKKGEINFPQQAMMIKAQWVPVDSTQIGKYYTKMIDGYDYVSEETTGYTLMGLVGFHLVTHELPNWVWSTFEYKENVGMCDYIGCKDNFGNTQAYIPPKKIIDQGYAVGGPSKALLDLFKKLNVPEVFQNYRLKGSMTEYTDNQGNANIVGNSILEMNLVSSSSCISCHARATLNNRPGDRQNLGMFEKYGISYDSVATPTATKGLHLTCITGTPRPKDYLNADKDGNVYPDSIFYQTNFMWQLAQHAKVCENDVQ